MECLQIEIAIINHIIQVEEYATEFDLRLHLHEPRQARITQDIHNVRASQLNKGNYCTIVHCLTLCACVGELIAHRERLSRHIQGTNAELNKYKSNIGTINNQLQSKVCGAIYNTHMYLCMIHYCINPV